MFRETLNESRDPDRGGSGANGGAAGALAPRYSARFYLKHSALELAFDMLHEAGFNMVGACGTGTNCAHTGWPPGTAGGPTGGAGDVGKPCADSEERRWNHYNEFIFCRSPVNFSY